MRCMKLITSLIYILINAHFAQATSKFFDLKEVKNWRIIAELDGNKKICYAIISPYRNKQLIGNINDPKFIVSYKGHLSYSISFSVLSTLLPSQGVKLFVNDSEYILKVNNHGKNAITYSAEQDVCIINDIISAPYTFKVKSESINGDIGIMYFSSLGLQEAIMYMEKNCKEP